MIKQHASQQGSPPLKAMYKGSLEDYQVKGSSHRGRRYQHIEQDFLNNHQNFLYHRALFGLSVYSQQEIKEMHWEKRKRILKVHKRTQKILNSWKQQILIALSNSIFTGLFPTSPITQELVSKLGTVDPEFKCNLSFKSLKIDKKQIVERLLTEGVLPRNFYELNQEITCK